MRLISKKFGARGSLKRKMLGLFAGFELVLLLSGGVIVLQYRRELQFGVSQVYLTGALILGFIFLHAFLGSWAISVLTEPILKLVRFLDEIDFENGKVAEVPSSMIVPETKVVARAFDRLRARLEAYQNLNLSRLYSEKQKSDLVAATISDGVILLNNEQIVYTTATADLILNAPGGRDEIFSSAKSSIPVKYVLESEFERRYFLMESLPISAETLSRLSVDVLQDQAKINATSLVIARDVTLMRESQEAREHFLGTISHEVKTPMTSLTLATRLLLKSVDHFENPVHQSLIRTCSEDVNRLRVLLDDFLTASKLDSLSRRMSFQEANFLKLIRQTVHSAKQQFSDRGIELQLELAPSYQTGEMVELDAGKISWAVSNLLMNALLHSSESGCVSLVLEKADSSVVLRVRDSGLRVEPQQLLRMFDKYHTYYDIRGSRLGSHSFPLAVSREIVESHHGRIWAKNLGDLGGVELGFSLPLRQVSRDLVLQHEVNKVGSKGV